MKMLGILKDEREQTDTEARLQVETERREVKFESKKEEREAQLKV